MHLFLTGCAIVLVGFTCAVSGQSFNQMYQQRQYRVQGGPRQRPAPVSSIPPTPSEVCSPGPSTPLTFPTSNEGHFPNILANGVTVDPYSRQGVFYEFRSRFKDQQVYNTRMINTLVCDGAIYLPGTYTPAVHWTQDYRYITLSTMNSGSKYAPKAGYRYNYGQMANCSYDWLDYLSRYNGVDFSNTFANDKGESSQDEEVYYLLFSKPGNRGFEIQYLCSGPNQQTGICNQVQVFVNTRVRPNEMTPEEVSEVESTTDYVLGPYGMSKEDLQKVIHRPNLDIEQCDMPPPQAFLDLVNGYAGSLPKRRPSDRNGNLASAAGSSYGNHSMNHPEYSY